LKRSSSEVVQDGAIVITDS